MSCDQCDVAEHIGLQTSQVLCWLCCTALHGCTGEALPFFDFYNWTKEWAAHDAPSSSTSHPKYVSNQPKSHQHQYTIVYIRIVFKCMFPMSPDVSNPVCHTTTPSALRRSRTASAFWASCAFTLASSKLLKAEDLQLVVRTTALRPTFMYHTLSLF